VPPEIKEKMKPSIIQMIKPRPPVILHTPTPNQKILDNATLPPPVFEKATINVVENKSTISTTIIPIVDKPVVAEIITPMPVKPTIQELIPDFVKKMPIFMDTVPNITAPSTISQSTLSPSIPELITPKQNVYNIPTNIVPSPVIEPSRTMTIPSVSTMDQTIPNIGYLIPVLGLAIFMVI
jgi:hypothetical protein